MPFAKKCCSTLPLEENSDNFVFDNQIIAQAVYFGFSIGELSCPTKYFKEASSISFLPSVRYGFGVLATAVEFFLQKRHLASNPRFLESGRHLMLAEPFEQPADLMHV